MIDRFSPIFPDAKQNFHAAAAIAIMLRRKPTKIDVSIEDKEEIEQARKTAADAAAIPSAGDALVRLLDRTQSNNPAAPSKSQRIGLSSS
ncbi:unnamed protein product [Linum tenue]|uniref:Uncharacterized protein n=1 Tax=Linum tenue TaxID=586396 RepID=A0AAV0HX16_9ROSI|nr:unnamed protein product [Linum tenue]